MYFKANLIFLLKKDLTILQFATILLKIRFLDQIRSQQMMNFFSKILDQPTEQHVFKFVPQIKISPKSTLHLQIQPNDPHTASNIVINAFASKTNRNIVPIKVQWSRYKFKSDEQYTIERIPSVAGNTYMCEPSDLGSIIQAKVKCLDSSVGGQAQASIGPIRIDSMLKRLIDGALYNQSLLSQIIIVQGQEKLNVNMRLGKNTMQFTQIDSSEKLTMPYTFSQPKIELSPKDPCKVYLRFEQDANNTVRNWLNKITGIQKNSQVNMNQSSLSMRIPHSNVSAVTSKTKLFQKSHVHCTNKLEVRFLSRNSRDLFLFTLRAFICKQDMKNSLAMQRIQTLQGLKSEQDYNKFLEYISLKSQIIRLAEIAKQLQIDRDNKIKDINNMQQSISEMTLTYLKIIQQKSQQQHVDLEQSYSMISMKRQQILGRKNFRQLKNQNQQLKSLVRDLNQQIELHKFFKKDNNQSMMFNQTTNPFLKKNHNNISGIIDQNQSRDSYYIANQNIQNKNQPIHKNMLQMSKTYLKVLEENKKLKSQNISGSKVNNLNNESRDIQNLLESLHQNQQEEKKVFELQKTIQNLKKDILNFKQINFKLQHQNSDLKSKLTFLNASQNNQNAINQPLNLHNSNSKLPQYSYYSRSNAQNNSVLSNSYISMNQSMTSEAELGLLQKKLIQLSNLNDKFQTQNMRLRKQRDYYRGLYENQTVKNKMQREMEPSRDLPVPSPNKPQSLQDSNIFGGDLQNSVIIRLKQQKQKLQNQKNSLLKKIDSITRQSNALGKPDQMLQKKCQQLSRQNQKLLQENEDLQKTIENIKSFHELEKKQLLSSQNSQQASSKSNNLGSIKEEQVQKLRKMNNSLLNELKQLRMQIQRKNDENFDNSRVIQLQNQLDIFKTYANGNHAASTSSKNPSSFQTPSSSSNPSSLSTANQQQLLNQLSQLKKQNQRLKQQISNLQLKIKTQTTTIQKLMTQLDEFHHQSIQKQNSFTNKYLNQSQNQNQSNINGEQSQKFKKKIIQLQHQLEILKRNNQAVNRSRDLSMSMMGYDEQRVQLYKKQNQALMFENQNLSKMCNKLSKDARQANIQVNKLRQKLINMNRQKLMIEQ